MTRGLVVVTLPVVVGFDAVDGVVDAVVVDVRAIGANDVLVVVDVGTVVAAFGRAVLHAATNKAVAIVMDRTVVVLVTRDWTQPRPDSFQVKIRKANRMGEDSQLLRIEAKHARV